MFFDLGFDRLGVEDRFFGKMTEASLHDIVRSTSYIEEAAVHAVLIALWEVRYVAGSQLIDVLSVDPGFGSDLLVIPDHYNPICQVG